MRSTTPFVWMTAALVLLFSIIPGSEVFAQFAFDGTYIECVDNGGAPDTVDATNDSIIVHLRIGGDIRYIDTGTEMTIKPSIGSGIIPYTPDTVNCVTSGATFNGYHMTIDSMLLGRGLSMVHPDSVVIVASVRLRLINICTTPGQVLSFETGARGVWNLGGLDKCGQATVTAPLPCIVCTEGCVLIQYEEVCGFRDDGIIAIDDRIWLDSLETSNLLSPGVDTVLYFADFRYITDTPADSLWPATGFVDSGQDTATVVPSATEDGICGDTIWIARIRYHQTDPLLNDTTMRVFGCVRPVDDVPPELVVGMIDTITVINGNDIPNDTLVGCCDTLRIWMATDSNQIGIGWPFSGDVDGVPYQEACGNFLNPNFDMSWIGVWLGGLIPSTDSSLYPHNSEDLGLLCPSGDTLLWLSARFGIGTDPGPFNDRMYIDISFCPEFWNAEIQACMDEILNENGGDLMVWGIDNAGNRSNWVSDAQTAIDDGICFDNVPPVAELGSDIYHSAGYCVKRFSPYDSTEFAHYRTNLSPDSFVWLKGRVDTVYSDIFNDVYYIGFDVRAMPEDTAPLSRLNYLHPAAPAPPVGYGIDTIRWQWDMADAPADTTRSAIFTWYGKQGTDSIDPVLSTAASFWKCNLGGGLTVGFTFARWMDAAGCNRILGSDYDGSTDIDENYTTRNQLRAVLDMCAPGYSSVSEEFQCTNLVLGSGAPFGSIPTYLWSGPNGVADDPVLHFRPQRNFDENPFDECLTEDTLFYRVRVDSVDLVGAITTWPGVNDSVRWYSLTDDFDGVGSPYSLWTPITFNAGDINGPVVEFTWGHDFNPPLPDGLYQLTLELRDDAGNVMLDSIYMWLNGAGPVIDSLRVVNMDTVCQLNYYTGYVQDSVGVWVRTDTTADQVLIDWTCVYNVPADRDSSWATLVADDGVTKTWFGYLIIDSSMVSPFASDNSYEVSPWEADCENANLNKIINVRAFDIEGADTLYSEADPDHLCDRAIIGISPCARLIGIDQYFYYADPDSPQTLTFGDDPDMWNAISPGKIDSMGGAGTYGALTNWANDQVQDSIFLRLLLDSASINPDTLDTLVIQFVNPTIYPPEVEPRIRELRKALFVPTSASLTPDPTINNTIFDGFLELDDVDQRFVEFRYYWNATWFIGAGEDSIMLVPYDQRDTIFVRAFTIAGDSIISIVGEDTTWLVCDTALIDSLDIDNINPDFYAGWTGQLAGRDPVTGTTPTVENLGFGSDCGFRFADGDSFRLRVLMTEPLHLDPAGYPNDLGSHNDAAGYWPFFAGDSPYRGAWQVSPIDLRTGDIFGFGPLAGDSAVAWVDEILPEVISDDSVYYTLVGHFDFPAAAAAWFIANGPAVDSVCLVIRSAWDPAGNPGRYNNPVFNDGLRWDSAEDTTFCVILQTSDPWAAGCPLVWGVPDSVLGWIAAEEDSVVVRATIIETAEIAICEGGTLADSAQVVEGDFQAITDDPNPWILPDAVGPWFIYVDPITDDTLGYAREYTWYLRADSADLATIHCDGDTLPFTLHFVSYGGVNSYHLFDECVRVDVNEPRWSDPFYAVDTSLVNIDGCIPSAAPFHIAKAFSDDAIDCLTGDGVGALDILGSVLADLSFLTGDANADSVAPDSVVNTVPGLYFAWWYIDNLAAEFQCVDSAQAWVKYYALTDSVGHYDRELFEIDTLTFCGDCAPPELVVAEAYCNCDSATYWYENGLVAQRPLQYVNNAGPISLYIFVRDIDGDSSSGMSASVSNYQADLSSIDPALSWTNAQLAHIWPFIPQFGAATWYAQGCEGGSLTLNHYYENGDTIFVDFRICDAWGNCDTVRNWPVAIVDTLAPIVDFIYTIGDDSIRAYVTPDDDHVHVYADINGYADDLISAPHQVWADFSNFWCDSLHRAWYDTVYASYVEQVDVNNYRAYWGWNPVDPYLIPGDTLSQAGDTLGTSDTLCLCADLGAEGYFDTLWVHVNDAACNEGTHFSVFEISGCDSTTPALDSVWVMGNGCSPGWISSTPLDSFLIEVWAWMDTTFDELADTLRIDSLQADLSALSPMYALTAWSPQLEGGAPVYGYTPDSSLIMGVLDTDGALLLPTYWTVINDGERDRLVGKWILLKADNLGCLDEVVIPVKTMRQTGQAGSHGYYIDVEYGTARVDTTRPVIYDMRVHSSTTSINETTWVSPNVPLYVDVWAYDTNCDPYSDHLGFDLDAINGPGPFITFCNNAGFDTIWTWDTTAFDVLYQNNDSLDMAWILIRFIGNPIYNDTCNAIDLNDITGCIEAHIEDCLSNPAIPVQREVTTDDVPPQYVMSIPWGDFTIATGFPGDPDTDGVDSVLVLQNSVYALDWDSTMFVYVIVDNVWNGDEPGDTLISWTGTYIDFSGFMLTPIQYPDEIYYNIDGNHRDSLVWVVPLYDGGGPLFNTLIPSDRYWYQLILADSLTNNTGDPWDEQPDPFPMTLFCDDLDSAISFTIQNWNTPNPGMILICDSNTVAGSDTEFVDTLNMALWNNEFVSPDAQFENLYKIYYAPGQWGWYSHEDVNGTRFFIFVEDTVLQSDDIDNDNDGLTDETGEGVDFYTADLRINDLPQVGHVDSMNVAGVWINYLWFADNFDEQPYNVSLFISDIYGHRDTLACEDYALSFYEDESCPIGETLSFWKNGEVRQIRFNNDFVNDYFLPDLSADDSMFVFADFDSISIIVHDPDFALFGSPLGSGPDLDTTTIDSVNFNNGLASVIELLDPGMSVVAGFVQNYVPDSTIYSYGPLMLVDPTDNALASLSDGWYTIRVTLLDRVGNSCVRTWPFRLDRTCPDITAAFTTRPGLNTPVSDLFTSWDYVEITAQIADSLDGVDSVHYEYCFDANRDGNLDVYPYWQVVNVLSDEGGAWDTDYPFTVYWNIRNLPWSSEDTLGLPPVRPDSCVNRYFVRVRAEDIYGHECETIFPVDITDDIAPLAYIRHVNFDFTPQGSIVPCYNPNENLGDSLIWVSAYDWIDPDLGYDPLPGDTFTMATNWFDLAKGLFQYKFYEAPGDEIPGNTDPAAGWVTMWTPGQDTATYRNWFTEAFHIQWNIKNLPSHQYNIRFVGIDVCGNADALNTPVITVRMECDTTAPIAVICAPDLDARVTNWRCDEDAIANDTTWVLVKSTSAIWADIDSVAFFFVDSLSVPGLGIHQFIGGDGNPLPAPSGFATEAQTRWNTNNLLSGWYWLYAVAYDNGGLFDTDPIWQRVYVDNTMPTVELCQALGEDGETPFVHEGNWFELKVYPSDPDGGTISAVLFQYLDRWGNWRDLPNTFFTPDEFGLYGADVYMDNSNPVTYPNWDGSYSNYVMLDEFGNSPLDSIRFRAIAVDQVDVGNNNWQGDYNRDCNIDRDLTCGTEVCCMAMMIYDEIPDSTNLWCHNHGVFRWSLPQYDESVQILEGDRFSTCNDQNPLDTLILTAKVHSGVEDGWLMHFKYWRSWPEGFETTPQYVPNDVAMNPTIPASGPIVLYHSWDSVYVVWSGVRAFIEAADAADGLTYSQWSFSAQVEDLTGNVESLGERNECDLIFACIPNAPITAASYVTNDVQNPNNRIRVTEPVAWNDFVSADTIEVIYNRTTGPGQHDPEALVLLYTDAASILNCRGQVIQPFNVQLWLLNEDSTLGRICPSYVMEPFAQPETGYGWDQYPPDDNMNSQYVVGMYLDNTFGPGVYNFAMIVRTDEVDYPSNPDEIFFDGDWNNDGTVSADSTDSTRIDLVIRVVNVNEPQVTICYPEYGAGCVAGNVPMSAHLVPNPSFTGEVDTVWFQYFDGAAWQNIGYDTDPDYAYVTFELNEFEVQGMAGWYYDMAGGNTELSTYAWYAERDLFPDVAVYVNGDFYPLTDMGNGYWSSQVYLPTNGNQFDDTCYTYAYVIDANDNNIWEAAGTDLWIADPRDACDPIIADFGQYGDEINASRVCLCPYVVNFPSENFENSSYNFRTVVGWHDEVAYHVIENPAPGDSVHVFFVDNEPAEATHDIEFDVTRLSGGMLDPSDEICNPADTVRFVTDVQPNGSHNLVVEDICKVVYQVSLTNNPMADSSWANVYTVLSDDDMGWTEAWPGWWVAVNPLADNVDNDGDGLVDETHDVQAGDQIGEENVKFWTRAYVQDYCGNTYVTVPESIWVDVSAPQACVTQVGDVAPADNQVIIVPESRDLSIVATDQSYADPGVIAIFQYRTLNPIGGWTNIEADTLSNDTVRHIGNTYTAVWDLLAFFQNGQRDPEGWYQLRAIAIDTVGNSDLCDNVVCQITIRLNDIQPAARVAIYNIYSSEDPDNEFVSCTGPDTYYIHHNDPYCITAIFAPTNIDTGLASLTFQYQSLTPGGDPSEWRNIETIYDHIDYGLNGDTTRCVLFQPRPEEVGDHGFNLRVLVEDYNGNDTSAVVALYVDDTPPTGTSTAGPSIAFTGPCGDRCRLDNDAAALSAIFNPDPVSGEVNVDNVWLTVIRDDSMFAMNLGELDQDGPDTWTFDFEGGLCAFWANQNLDMGCYHFTVHFTDCVGNEDSVAVTTTCGEGESTDLICIDCIPALPEHASLDYMTYTSANCALQGEIGYGSETITDNVLDGTTEVGNQTVTICGHLPTYQQYISSVWLFVESEEAGVESTLVDTHDWPITWNSSVDTAYCFTWNLIDEDELGNLLYPSGYYHVWVLAVDAICQIQVPETIGEFWVNVDNTKPEGTITQINGVAPNPSGPDVFEIFGPEMGFFWVEWTDGLTPDDSTQAHNQVQLWAKNSNSPNQADAWHMVGEIPSPCNPHFVVWYTDLFACGDSLDIVATVIDRWYNGSLGVDEAMEAFDDGRFVDIVIEDTTPPHTELWSIGTSADVTDEDATVPFDQQNHFAVLSSNFWDQDVYLTAFSALGDLSIERVYFQYSLDGTTWFDIAVDNEAAYPDSCNNMTPPLPWWCEFGDRNIMWQALWDISGLRGHVWVRSWGEDVCGNVEAYNVYQVAIDVQAPMATVFAWLSDVNVDNLPCGQWTEPQIADTVERYSIMTFGACPDSVGTPHYDAYGALWYIKRANDNPLDYDSWCFLGDDSTGPFSLRSINLWDRNDLITCTDPVPGGWYDIAVRMNDQFGHTMPWEQMLFYAVGNTPEEKWQDLINRGYVKRFQVVDHTAPVAFDLMAAPDCTADSSLIFLSDNVTLTATVTDPDVVALTFAVREQGAEGPWTVIERIEGDSGTTFTPAEGFWNTELLNGTYILGAFAEDGFGNMDGDLNVADQWPTHTLTVAVDNEPPTALITSVWLTDDDTHTPITQLERGSEVTFDITASDNFTVRKVRFYYRHSGGDPDAWTQVGGDRNWPFSFNWIVPTDLVVGWTYDFAAVGVDYCENTDRMDGQGNYIIDWTAPIVDNEANISIVTIGGVDAETTPHIHGTDICIVAHSEPQLDHVRFIYVAGDDTTEIRTIAGAIGQTEWSLCSWDVTVLPEGPGQVCAIGSADLGGDLVTLATDCRNVVIDHTIPYTLTDRMPLSHGLVGGDCELDQEPNTDDLWITFNTQLSDASIDTVWFEWKNASDPNDEIYWHGIAMAIRDQGLTGRWAYAWDATEMACGTITLRAVASDNAVPESNEALIIFADSVRVDNCPPEVNITNVNGDVTPDGAEIGVGQVATIVATVIDPFSNGGTSGADSVAFFYGIPGEGTQWFFIGYDAATSPWQVMWNTADLTPGFYLLRAEAWDVAGNCATTEITINVVDQLYQRAWIIGFDNDNDPGCDDRIWAITDDCPPNYTLRVMFQYSTDAGTTWISLGEDQTGEEWCDGNLDYNMWDLEYHNETIPAGAIFRAVATDESNNDDPAPPRFQFTDVTGSATPVIFDEDFVRLTVGQGQVPWVSSLLEQAPPDENCFTAHGLVCVEPTQGSPNTYAGVLSSNTRPCNLNNRDGKVTVYAAVPTVRSNVTWMVLTRYEMNIHEVSVASGSNGWLVSEDSTLSVYVPVDGVSTNGTMWFEPAADDDVVNMLPPNQYYYSWLSGVEYILTDNIRSGDHENRFRARFNRNLLPTNPDSTQVIAAYYDLDNDLWTETRIIYLRRDLVNGIVEFYFPDGFPTWNASGDNNDCPWEVAFAIFYSSVRPLDTNVRFADSECEWAPDSTYYTPTRGPTTDCNPTFWAVMRQGEYVPEESTIDVYLDGIRIINDGEPDSHWGHGEDGSDLFLTSWDPISGVYQVWFDPEAAGQGPWFGCLSAGQHNVQFYTDNLHTNLTPFFVDVTPPDAWTSPGYVNHQITLWAELTDPQSGIDTTNVEVDIFNCDYYGGDIYYEVHQDAMTFTPIPNGYRASFQVQWEAIQYLWDYDEYYLCENPQTMCVEWEFVANKVCLNNEDDGNETEYYAYTIDVEPPTVTAVSPIGAPIDDDGDGITNEDWRDCQNNDNDFWWSDSCLCWMPRYDEDPINFAVDTFMYGERLTISAAINDLVMCCSGASQVDMRGFQLWIDGHVFATADTANHNLNFHIYQQFGNDDAVFTWGGPSSGTPADFAYEPGQHQIIVNAADSVGNVGSQGFAWTYYVRASGPAISFTNPTGECGLWFNPEQTNRFNFCVDATAGSEIAINGIQYVISYVPSGEIISGPTTINPTSPTHHCVDYILSGSFPDGQTGIQIAVTARNIHATPEDPINGITESRMTFTADNLQPTFTNHLPADNAVFTRDQAVVIEVFYTDDSPSGINGGDNTGGTILKNGRALNTGRKAEVRMSSLDGSGASTPIGKTVVDLPASKNGRGDNRLDDNGSGIDVSSFRMTIVKPNGDIIVPTTEQYVELDAAHAKYVLVSGQMAGNYLVNVRVEDCVENIAAMSWPFIIMSAPPTITFEALPDTGCYYDGYWNPNTRLPLYATIREMDGVNVAADGISVDIVRVYACETGLCTDTLIRDAAFDFEGPLPDPNNTDQTFTIEGSYTLSNLGPTMEIHVVLTVTNVQGSQAVRVKPWIVDGTAPWITVVAPMPNTVVPQDEPVTISANFGDAEMAMIMAPGTRTGLDIPTIQTKRGPQRMDESSLFSKSGTSSTVDSKLGAWGRAVNDGGLDELDGDVGVDPACIELLLVPHSGADPLNLTSGAVITANNISWTGNLEPDVYTVILSVCDFVCNTGSVNWDFEVGRADTLAPMIELLRPMPSDTIHQASPAPTFDIRVTEVGGSLLDEATIRVRLERNSVVIASRDSVNMNELNTEALVSLTPSNPLENGDYVLYIEASDNLGNRADANWTYFVRIILPPQPGDLTDESAYNYPNPFEYGEDTYFHLPLTNGYLGTFVTIKIYDFAGQHVADVFDGPYAGGEVVWRGVNNNGEYVANGVYLAHVVTKANGKSREDIVKVAFKNKK